MTHTMKRIEGICWDRRHCMVVMQSLRLMVLSGVLRRAEVDPPQHRDDCVDIEVNPEESLSMPPVTLAEQGWVTRFFHRRDYSPFTHTRHTT